MSQINHRKYMNRSQALYYHLNDISDFKCVNKDQINFFVDQISENMKTADFFKVKVQLLCLSKSDKYKQRLFVLEQLFLSMKEVISN